MLAPTLTLEEQNKYDKECSVFSPRSCHFDVGGLYEGKQLAALSVADAEEKQNNEMWVGGKILRR
jgi:hypothetical protein